MTLQAERPDWQRLSEVEGQWEAPVLVTVVATSGSTPRKAGARMLVNAQGPMPKRPEDFPHPEGTIGGGAVEVTGLQLAWEAWQQGHPVLREVPLTAQLGMCCGGTMTLLAQPVREEPFLVVLGAGHVGQAVGRLASECGFAVIMVDPRKSLHTEAMNFARRVETDFDPETLDALPRGPQTHCLVVTHDHGLDQELVEALIHEDFASFSMLGSERKAIRFRQRLQQQGVAPEIIQRMESPAGLDLPAENPAEIAVAIVGELIRKRRKS
ncbi:MAG TPA: xanthine dehydrogenase accessory protein XdhC [Myxococcales bacterium]|nr:xanthine dehydrogenase accessory protein XdhC [Myxococcales bacterium]